MTERSDAAAATARLFVALDLPADARAALVAWRERAFAGRPELRLVEPAALHVTLVFLGHVAGDRVDDIGVLVREAAPARPAPLLGALGLKPVPLRRPRLIALELADEGGRAGSVQAAVSDALANSGLYVPERRAFWPHVTLARVRKGARAGALPETSPPPGQLWRAEALTLYRSHLRREGARYEAVERVPLGR